MRSHPASTEAPCVLRTTGRASLVPGLAETSEDALRDVFGARGGPEGLVAPCEANFGAIEKIAVDLRRRRSLGLFRSRVPISRTAGTVRPTDKCEGAVTMTLLLNSCTTASGGCAAH